MQRARLRIENEPSRGIREIKLHSLKRVKFPRYLEIWNCLNKECSKATREYRESSFALVMTRERKPISSLKIIEGNRNLDRRGWASRSKKYDLATRKWFQGTSEKESLPWIRKVGRGGRGREMFIESDILSPRSISFYERRVRSRWKLQGFVLGLER